MSNHAYQIIDLDDITPSGGYPLVAGDRFHIDPGWTAANDATTLSVSDGGTGNKYSGNDPGQTQSVDGDQIGTATDSDGTVVGPGSTYADEAWTFTAPDGTTITAYTIYIDGTAVGLIADAALQPGVVYDVAAVDDVGGGNAPNYTDLVSQDHDPSGADVVQGSYHGDTLQTGAGDDTVAAGGGDDRVELGDGDDDFGSYNGEHGDDTVYGGAGHDAINTGDGNDLIHGGDGNDYLVGGSDDDIVYGEGGDDIIQLNDDHETDVVDGGTGWDSLEFNHYQSVDEGVVVSFAADGAGTYGWRETAANGSFSSIEGVIASGRHDTVDASATGTGVALDGRGGDDSLVGGRGDDTLIGQTGNDTLIGNAGADYAAAGAGDDSVEGGAGADYLEGGSGGDTIHGGDDNDQLFGQHGDDSLTGGAGDDSLDGGADNDTLEGGDGADTLVGGHGDDSLLGEDGADLLRGGTGNDTLNGGTQDDTLEGGDGDDSLRGGANDDMVSGDAGRDELFGGSGADTLRGGADDDTIETGSGSDHIILDRSGGNDVITDFDIGDHDGDGRFNDQLDISELQRPDGTPVRATDVVVSDDGNGNARLTFPEGESVLLQGVAPAQISGGPQLFAAGIPCFTAGTLLETPRGPRPVEFLRPGDLVQTVDDGPQPILWAAARWLDHRTLVANPALRPIRIAPGALGNDDAVLVSPQHGIGLRSDARGGDERFVRATHLARLRGGGIRVATGIRQVTYVHLMFARHQALISHNLVSESFFPG
ncbi:MAG: Hint domain-containing protein, partial [Pseudomonadota bacterium]